MLLRRRVALVTTVSAVMLGLVTVPASSADRTAPAGTETSLKPGDAYVISDPKLVADPQKAADVLKKDGDLDRLDIKPTSGPTAEPPGGAETRAPWTASHRMHHIATVSSGRPPGAGARVA